MQTLIIRIEDPPARGGAFGLRGLSLGQGQAAEAEQAVGEVRLPLPALEAGQPDRDALVDVQQVMLAAGDADFTADEVGRYLWRLLARDSCREDAHRLVMRCYVKRGERAAALRHYQVCADLLRVEFDASPEPATVALFEQIRSAREDI